MSLVDLLNLTQRQEIGVRLLKFQEACRATFDGDSEVVVTTLYEVLDDLIRQAAGECVSTTVPHFPEASEVRVCRSCFEVMGHRAVPVDRSADYIK